MVTNFDASRQSLRRRSTICSPSHERRGTLRAARCAAGPRPPTLSKASAWSASVRMRVGDSSAGSVRGLRAALSLRT